MKSSNDDFLHVPDWIEKPEGYQTGSLVKYQGHTFIADFRTLKPGEGDPSTNGWRLYDEFQLMPESAMNKWMQQVRGNQKLSELTLPGTNETCASHGTGFQHGRDFLKCQDLALKKQLDAGIRFIDIQCRHGRDGAGLDNFLVYYRNFYQNLTFDADVRDVCINFLKENPSECLIMSIKEEENSNENLPKTFEETLNEYKAGFENYWYLEAKVPTLDEVRGKIVLFRRYKNGSQGIGANPEVWKDNATFDVKHSNGFLKIQDEYYVSTLSDTSDKWGKVERLLNEAETGNKNDWYINNLSGSIGVFPIHAAHIINPKLLDYLRLKHSPIRLGTILMDFPDDVLIRKITEFNQ